MKNIDNQDIEAYIRGEMDADERTAFEQELSQNPELVSRVEAMRQFSEGIQAVGRADLKKRIAAVRRTIEMEEAEKTEPINKPPFKWLSRLLFAFLFTLLGLLLGYLLFHKEQLPQPDGVPVINNENAVEVAKQQYDSITTLQVAGPKTGSTIAIPVHYKPDLDTTGTLIREYALDQGGTGLCLFVRSDDLFWQGKTITFEQHGKQFFLVIDGEKYLLKDDGGENELKKE